MKMNSLQPNRRLTLLLISLFLSLTAIACSTKPAERTSTATISQNLDTVNSPSASKLANEWVVTQISGQDVTVPSSMTAPSLTLDLDKRVVYGNDSCNRLNGPIEQLDESHIKFGPLATTRMLCANMTVPTAFTTVFRDVAKYTFDGDTLYLLDPDGTILLQLQPAAKN